MAWLRTAKRVDWNLVRSLAEQVRAEVTNGMCDPSAGACIEASEMLAAALQAQGYDAVHYDGGFFKVDNPDYDWGWLGEYTNEGYMDHHWVELDGQVVDPTADQFNIAMRSPMPEVYVGPRAGRYLTFDEVEATVVERVKRPVLEP